MSFIGDSDTQLEVHADAKEMYASILMQSSSGWTYGSIWTMDGNAGLERSIVHHHAEGSADTQILLSLRDEVVVKSSRPIHLEYEIASASRSQEAFVAVGYSAWGN